MSSHTCKKLLIPQFIIARIIILASSFTILGWGYRASVFDHLIVAAIMVCAEVVHYGLLFYTLRNGLTSYKCLFWLRIIELVTTILFLWFLIWVMVKDWPINWIYLYVLVIQLSPPVIRSVIYSKYKTIIK